MAQYRTAYLYTGGSRVSVLSLNSLADLDTIDELEPSF